MTITRFYQSYQFSIGFLLLDAFSEHDCIEGGYIIHTKKEVKKMEFEFSTKESAVPCWVVADEDNGRYMIRKADTSGEVFNSKKELVQWIERNWSADGAVDAAAFGRMLEELRKQ
jgi:hypothetical protein